LVPRSGRKLLLTINGKEQRDPRTVFTKNDRLASFNWFQFVMAWKSILSSTLVESLCPSTESADLAR
jgi:hypothetical protein